MHASAFVSLMFLVIALPAGGQSFDRPVTTLEKNAAGVYHAPFMYWYTTVTPFLAEVEFIVLGEVVSVDHATDESGPMDCRLRLGVREVLVCPAPLVGAANEIRYLETDTCEGVADGDSVLVFMTRYGGMFAIPNWRGTNTSIGYRMEAGADGRFCAGRRLAALFRSGHAWDLSALGSEDLRLWSCMDSEGLLEALIEAKEKEEGLNQRP
jgi:hypothetical protein